MDVNIRSFLKCRTLLKAITWYQRWSWLQTTQCASVLNIFVLFCCLPLVIHRYSCSYGISCTPGAPRTWEPIKDIDILASILSQGKNWQEFQVQSACRRWLPFPYGFQIAFTPSENPRLRKTQQGLRRDSLQTAFDSHQHNLLETFCFCWKHSQPIWELLEYIPSI